MRALGLLSFLAIFLLLQGCASKPDKVYTCRQYYEKQATLMRNNAEYFPVQQNPCDSLDSSITPPPFAALYQVNYYPAATSQK